VSPPTLQTDFDLGRGLQIPTNVDCCGLQIRFYLGRGLQIPTNVENISPDAAGDDGAGEAIIF